MKSEWWPRLAEKLPVDHIIRSWWNTKCKYFQLHPRLSVSHLYRVKYKCDFILSEVKYARVSIRTHKFNVRIERKGWRSRHPALLSWVSSSQHTSITNLTKKSQLIQFKCWELCNSCLIGPKVQLVGRSMRATNQPCAFPLHPNLWPLCLQSHDHNLPQEQVRDHRENIFF